MAKQKFQAMITLVDHTDQVSGFRYKIEIETHNKLRYYKGIGKSFPTTTIGRIRVWDNQGRLKRSNGHVVVKHANDPDNPKLAARLVAKECLNKTCHSRKLRTDLWKEINKNAEKL